MRKILLSLVLPSALLVACSANGSGSSSTGGGGGAGGGGGQIGTDAGLLDASGGSDDAPYVQPPAVAHLTGTVLAPEGTIPISGALVYLSATMPEAIPDGVFCDRCVELPRGVSFTFATPDGRFDLGAPAFGHYNLVVQKGQFRRIRPIDVTADAEVPKDLTTLPAKMDKANGDDVPKMAIVMGAWDKIEVSLARLGLGKIVDNGIFGQSVDPATAAFDMYGSGLPGSPGYLDPNALLADPSLLSKYHILFVPCSFSSGTTCDTWVPAADTNVKKNLQDFVAAGGKLYATDYSYEFVRQPFPGYVTWQNESSAIGSACLQGSYDAPASSPDQGLTDWLAVQGTTSFEVVENWTQIRSVNPVQTTDVDGNPATITPKVWIEGQTGQGTRPVTVAFERACGRVLFSTYHTEAGSSAGLLPQEKALLYVLLEVGVCVKPPSVN